MSKRVVDSRSLDSRASNACVLRAQATEQSCFEAVESMASQLEPWEASASLLFCSPAYDRAALSGAISALFPKESTIACTTAGEIFGGEHFSGGMTGLSFRRSDFESRTFQLTNLRSRSWAELEEFATKVLTEALNLRKPGDERSAIVILLSDARSQREDDLVAALNLVLGHTAPIIGASSGDDARLNACPLFRQGEFVSDCACVLLLVSDCRMLPFKTHHIDKTETRLVITKGDPSARTVFEINGEPALDEYARIVGVSTDMIKPDMFQSYPLVVLYGQETFVRSIESVDPVSRAVNFYCAVEEGMVLRVGTRGDMIADLSTCIDGTMSACKLPDALLTFECVLRKVEIEESELSAEIRRVQGPLPFVGFHSLGEQFGGLHMSQTITGVCFGR